MKDETVASKPSPSRSYRLSNEDHEQDAVAVTPTSVRAAARAALKEEETRPAVSGTQQTDSQVKHTPRPPPKSSRSNADDDISSKGGARGSPPQTFITALAPLRRLSKTRGESLRPPSPLAPLDAVTDYVYGNGPAPEPPIPANYMGAEAVQQFWKIFHRQDAVHNNKATGPSSTSTNSGSMSMSSSKSSGRRSNAAGRPKSARTTYLSAVRSLRLCPEPLGIVRRRLVDKTAGCASGSTAQEVNLSSYRMGDAYAEAFSEGLPLVPGVESLNLSHNRIGDVAAARLITAAAPTANEQGAAALQQLNLAHNSLAKASSHALANLLRRSRAITSLNLSHTRLRDREVQQLCEALTPNQTVLRLHLSENHFGIPGMLAVARFLEENARIEELYLAWNQLRGLGALKIVEALKFHASLRVCDLSWNALGSSGSTAASSGSSSNASGVALRPRAVVTALADSLANNKVLAHLDLSSNRLDVEDCALLAKQLESNQTLVGLHMSGNCGVVDSRGFLVPKAQAHSDDSGGSQRLREQHKLYSIAVFEEAHSDAGSGIFPAHLAPLVDASCWYCGLWVEHRFSWTPLASQGPFAGSTDRFEITPGMEVRLHLSLEDWRGIPMERRDSDSDSDGNGSGPTFSALRVLPPGPTNYFFSVVDTNANPDGPPRVSFHYVSTRPSRTTPHRRQPSADAAAQATRNSTGDAENNTGEKPTQERDVFGGLERVNVVRIARRENRDPCNTLVPRSTGKNSERRSKWDINKSVFARRKRESVCRNFVDTDAFVAKAFAADWRQCKIDRFVKDPVRRREVEASVTRGYRIVCNAYRRYCGHGVLVNLVPLASLTAAGATQLQNDVTCVPWAGYMEFVSDAGILDDGSEYCSMPDLENVFVAANLELTQEAKEKDNPDRSLTRFEFLECVIRIAVNKYFRTNVCDTPAKAVDKLIQENVLSVAPEDSNEFRSRFLYTEEISDIFTEHITLLQELYNANMGKYCKPGEKKGMHLVEFLQFMEKYQVYSDSFRVRDVKDPFLACKLVVLDEMTTVGHKKLYLTDFMELVLRVSVLRYPPRPVTLPEVARSLQKLFANHFYKHDALLEQFCEAVDQAVVQERIEAFANAINSHKKSKGETPAAQKGGRAVAATASAGAQHSAPIAEEGTPEDEEDEGDGNGNDSASSTAASDHPDASNGTNGGGESGDLATEPKSSEPLTAENEENTG